MGVHGDGVLVKMDAGKPKLQAGRPSRVSLQNAQRDLTEKQVQYVVWAATPEKYRQPRDRVALGKVLGVSEVTMWRWSKNPKVIQATRWMVMHQAGDPERIGQILDILYQIANDASQATGKRVEAAREFLAAVGVKQMWKNPTPDLLSVKEVDEIDLDALTDEEVWELYYERSGGYGDLQQLEPGVTE